MGHDVAQGPDRDRQHLARRRDHGADERGLARDQAELAEEATGSMAADDLGVGALAVDDGDQTGQHDVELVAHLSLAVEDLPLGGRADLTVA